MAFASIFVCDLVSASPGIVMVVGLLLFMVSRWQGEVSCLSSDLFRSAVVINGEEAKL